MVPELSEAEKRFLVSAGIISVLCVAFFCVRVILSGVTRYVYVPENLALAWLALILAWFLTKQLKVRRWLSWQNILLSVLWLFFVPNAWYVLTDFIHVDSRGEVSQLFDIMMMSSLVFAGFCVGFASLFLVHKELNKRFKPTRAHLMVAVIILLSSFAIYMGRNLRWNTWDIIADPSGILLNVSDRLIDPLSYPSARSVTFLFFVLLGGIYTAIWQFFGQAKQKS